METSTTAVQDFTSFVFADGETLKTTYLKLISNACNPDLSLEESLCILSNAEKLSFEEEFDIDGLHFLLYRIKTGLIHDFMSSKKEQRYKDHTEKLVYFIKSKHTGLIKIGYASDVFERIKQLSSGNTDRLLLLKTIKGGKKKESELHKLFDRYRKEGEWFYPSDELLGFIDSL